MNCQVCCCRSYKYKCPKCLTKYCSVTCYKRHSESPASCRPNKVKEDNAAPRRTFADHRLWDDESKPRFPDEDSDAQVPLTTLHLLGKSEGVINALRNPHLRAVMSYLDATNNPERAIEAAMAEPIFAEFVEECLKVADPVT